MEYAAARPDESSARAVIGPLGIRPPIDDFACGRHLRLPPHPERRAEGGLRLAGQLRESRPGAPLVSVVTVVYNRAATLAQCIESVRAQHYDNIEYVIVDGASDDGTLEVIERFADHIDYYVSQPDAGIYDAMNTGLTLARGEYILLLNSDDWYRPDAIGTLVEAALAADAEIAHADAVTVNQDGRTTGALEGPLHAGLYTSGSLIRHETMLVRRDVYDRFGGYDTSYRIIADYLLAIQLLDADCRFEYVPERLLYFRETGISKTADALRLEERRRLFATLFPFLEEADLALLTRGRLPNAEMVRLIGKYKNRSEPFVRSLAFNIAASPSFRLAETVFESFARRARASALWEVLRPAKRWLYRRLPGP